MPKLQLDVSEITNPDLNFVSLVKRGANRIPFRIVKEDTTDMLDLHKIGRKLFKQADPTPAVVAAVVRKGADLDLVKERLTKAGLSVEHMEEKDGVVVFSQPNVHSYDEGVIKLDDDVGLVVAGISKAFESFNFEDTEFGKVFATEAFYPSLHMAKDMLGYTVGNIMSKAESPSEAAALISKAVDDFKAYVTSLAQNIPVHAFKADVTRITVTHTTGDKDPAATAKPADPAATEPTEEQVEKEEISENPQHGNPKGKTGDKATKKKTPDNDIEEDPTAGNPKGTTGPAVAVKKEDVEALIKGVQDGFTAALGALTKQLTDALGEMKTQLGQVEAKVQKAEEAIAGTVITDPGADRTVIHKTTGKGAPPLLDTAFTKLDDAA